MSRGCAPTRTSSCLHLHAAILLSWSLGIARMIMMMRSRISVRMVYSLIIDWRLRCQLGVKQSSGRSQSHARVASVPVVAELGNNALLTASRVMWWLIDIWRSHIHFADM